MAWRTLVAASALVTDADRVLLIRQQRGTVSSLELPGGYLDAGESLEEAAAREAKEEAGIDVVVGRLAFTIMWHRSSDERSNFIAVFEALPAGTEWLLTPQDDEGIESAEFVPREQIEVADLHPMYQEALRHWLQAPPGSAPAHWIYDYGDDGSVTLRDPEVTHP